MANEEHLKILKQGLDTWNQWRRDDEQVRPDLSHAKLRRADLRLTNLEHVDLTGADLSYANLRSANLRSASLHSAKLPGAALRDAILRNADLQDADLAYAILNRAYLNGAVLSNAVIAGTTFGDNDLRSIKGLNSVRHIGPSIIGIDTLKKSGGMIPAAFLRGCGLSDWEIEAAKLYNPDLKSEEITNILYQIQDLRAHQPIQINPLFISYSHTDSFFVERIEQDLNNRGIRFWRDVHHATSGRLEKQIDRAIRLNPTVLLVLSSGSVKSDWVQHEVRLARKLEIETGRDVMCPVALDDSWKDCQWPERLREQIMEYNILDFSKWKDDHSFERTFAKLIEGLDLFYK